MSGILVFSFQQKANCVNWYKTTNSITGVQQNYFGTRGQRPPSWKLIPRLMQIILEYGTVKRQNLVGRHSRTSKERQSASLYIYRYSIGSARTAETDLDIPRNSNPRIIPNTIYSFPYRLDLFRNIKILIRSTSFLSNILHMKYPIGWFFSQPNHVFWWTCLSC